MKHPPSPHEHSSLDRMLAPVATENWTADSANDLSDTERRRLEELDRLGILHTPTDRTLQSFIEQALKIVPGTTISAVSLVKLHIQWFKARIGLDVEQTSREHSFCSHTIQTNGVLIVNDAREDPRFADNALVTGGPQIRFYAGVKLTRAAGALCVIGTSPRDITRTEIGKLVQLAQFVDIQLLTAGPRNNLKDARGDQTR